MGQHQPWTPECEHVALSFIEGNSIKKVCGHNKERTQYVSKGPRLTVRFAGKDASGFIHCTAYNNREPEAQYIDLQPNGRVQTITTPEGSVPNFDKLWILRSTPNTRISLQCDVGLVDYNPCYKDVLTIDLGNEVKELCGSQKVTLFTKSNAGKVRIQLNEFGDRNVKCIVQAVTGPNANQFLNVVSEEVDSSEFGVTRGSRGTSCNCGRRHATTGRVMFGKETKENEFPWMVLLNVYTHLGGGRMSMSYCGASVITQRHILTAAHCVVQKNPTRPVEPQNVYIKLAEHHSRITSGKEKEVRGKELFVHENYLQRGSHDIAVIFTDQTIEYNDFIGPICLTREVLPVLNKRITIMGWGQTETGRGSDVLLKAKATVMDNQLCGGLPDFEICTHAKPSTTCYGDSGGPLVWLDPETNRYTQVSLVSRGTNEICNKGIGIHTHVASFYDWIENIIQRTDRSSTICHKI
uniref:Venom serine protease with cub domain 15 n=1 Tax=Pristhesancus plagipennis TaxID=1955184 RepID=A0A1Q1NP94_PRIPG|nr:venom serine protease with cub domain 15 [Pristhesancus plagipennis]